ncbi:hypothetical protein BH11PAT2_BH11PAT2_04100 [soil metagenome]
MESNKLVLSSEASDETVQRTFRQIETWGGLVEQWALVETEPEAVGLLYCAANFKRSWGNGPQQSARDEEDRVRFFLDCAALSNKRVSTVAAQMIVKHVLERRQHMEIDGQWYVKTDGMLLQFLREPRDCLCEAPYPRFIGEYLARVHGIWYTGDEKHQVPHHAYQPLTPYLIDALLAWGMAGLLAFNVPGEHRQLIYDKIEALLKNHGSFGYSFTQALSDISKEPFKTMPPAAKEEAVRRAALVLMKNRVWEIEYGDKTPST